MKVHVKVRYFATTAAVAAALTLLAACGGSSSSGSKGTSASSSEQTLTMAVQELGTTVDPATFQLASIVPLQAIELPFVYYGLHTVEKSTVSVYDPSVQEPGAAESWKLVDGGKALQMTLRKGVMSPYGHELTTADVQWTVERNLALKDLGDEFFASISGVSASNQIKVINKYTFQWNLEKKNINVVRSMNLQFEAPFDATEAKMHATAKDPWASQWLSTHGDFFGPYQITQFTPGQSMTLEPNPHFFGKAPAIKKIVIRQVPDPATRQQLISSGAVQYAAEIPRVQLAKLESASGVKVEYGRATTMLYLITNTKIKPWSNPLVRKAVAWALPTQEINEQAYLGTATVATGPISPLFPGHDGSTWPYTHVDLSKAKELMTQAGYPHGFSTTLEYSLSNPGPENAQVAVIVQKSLAKIGIKIQLQQASSDATFFEGLLKKTVPFGLDGAAPFIGEAAYDLENTSAGASGFANYENPKFLADVATASEEETGAKREAALDAAQKLWAEEVPMYPVLEPNYGVAMATDLEGFNIQNTGLPRLDLFHFGS